MPHATDVTKDDKDRITDTAASSDHVSADSTTIDQLGGEVRPHHEPENVQAQLHYLSPSVPCSKENPPIQVVTSSTTTRDPRTTVKIQPGPLESVFDVRGHEHDFTLQNNGFQFVRDDCPDVNWDSKSAVWNTYIEGLKNVVANAMGGLAGGVDEVIAFHQGKRGSNKEWRQANDGQRTNPFARQVHVDQSEETIRRIVKEKTDIKGDWLWKGRVRQVNAWRPLYHPVYDCGLCVADSQTVVDEDLVECKRIREADGEYLDTMGVVKYRAERKWYYKSLMDPNDVVLFMGYDSDCKRGKREGTGFTLHSAFDIPDPPAGAPPRASIEVRFLVFTWPQEPLVIRPGLGMLTTQVPPRGEALYETFHTDNLEVEGEEEELPSSRDVVSIADPEGSQIQIDLNEYDQLRWRPSSSHPQSPTTSPALPLEVEITEAHLVALTDARVADLRRQMDDLQRRLRAAEKMKEMVEVPETRSQMTRVLNERRVDEMGKRRLELARRLRGSFSGGGEGTDAFFDL